MKYFVWFFLTLILLYTTNLAFAAQENPVHTKAQFPDSIKIGEKAKFSVKVTNIGYYFVSDIKPVIEVNPKSASSFVHVEVNPSVTALWGGYSGMIYGTIYVDKDIPVERIFVSVYFVAKDSNGEQISLVNPENNISIKIEKSSDIDAVSIFGLEKEKPTCSNSKAPLYGCSDVVTVKIDSPLKQFKDGIDPHKIQCKKDLHVLTKRPNGKIACVYPLTAEKLGWKIINAASTMTPSIFEVPKGDRIFDVEYTVKGGMIKDMVFSNKTNSLLVTIDSTDKGSLILSIPRDLLDSKSDYCPPHQTNPPDDRFFVLLDKEEIPYDEIQTTPEKRTLQIQFDKNASKIEIIAMCLI